MKPGNFRPVSIPANSRRERQLWTISHPKKLRSKVPRRKRLPPRSINRHGSIFHSKEEVDDEATDLPPLQEASSSSSCFASGITCESSSVFTGSLVSEKQVSSAPCKRKANETTGDYSAPKVRPITRWYARRMDVLRSVENKENEIRAVGISSGSDGEEESSKQKSSSKRARNAASGLSISEVSPVGNLKKKARCSKDLTRAPEVEISESSCLESVSNANAPGIPKLSAVTSQYFSSHEEEAPEDAEFDPELGCNEELSYGSECSEYSACNEMTLSEFESEIFRRSSQGDFSDYSPSFLVESSDDFSEGSRENSIPSATFSLSSQLALQFWRSSSPMSSSGLEGEYSDEFIMQRFEDRDVEESYKLLRSRERKQVMRHDYAEEYCSTTVYGDLILEQRMVMVNWIVQYSNEKQLHCETLFLGVNLMDRFLSRGFFNAQRNLQLLGIACLTLATRIEENQPYNCIRQKTFLVGSNTYNRSEVVAMEWLIQEVLNFQCFLPTTYNFLWFYLKAAGADLNAENLTKYLAVLLLLDHEVLCFWPSSVAAGLVILASLAVARDSSCNRVMEIHVRSSNDDLSECIQSLEWLVKYAC